MIISTDSLVHEFARVYPGDPALDQRDDTTELVEKFHESGNWDVLPLKGGDKPVRWLFRPLRGRAKLTVQSMAQRANGLPEDARMTWMAQVAYVAFQLALQRADGLHNQDGNAFKLGRSIDSDTGLSVIDEATMALLYDVDGGGLVFWLGLEVVRKMSPNPQ